MVETTNEKQWEVNEWHCDKDGFHSEIACESCGVKNEPELAMFTVHDKKEMASEEENHHYCENCWVNEKSKYGF